MPQTEFVHLHLHSHFSLLDGANRIGAVAQRASSLGMPALALTDHGNLFGAVQFHDTVSNYGLKPIIGCEVYMAREGRTSRSGRSDRSNHLVLLAKNEEGYRNLVRLVSTGFLEGFYYRPRIDLELLQRHSRGLIALSACLKGIVAWNLTQDRYQEAKRQAGRLAEIFEPGDFYLEVQDHGIPEQKRINPDIAKLARQLDLPLVATNDCHYLSRDESVAHDVLLCIQTGKTVNDTNRLQYKTDQFYFKTGEEMAAIFGHLPQALSNSLEIAEKCSFQLSEPANIFPQFEVPPGYDLASYFEKVVRDGFEGRLKDLKEQEIQGRLRHGLDRYRQRLDREIEMIKQMNFPGYFLIVWDFIRFARQQRIPVGPGRGSVAGSLVSYALRITDIDPLRYDLLFERFLNPERVTPPDIDIDFCMLGRNDVIEYVTRKYGRENVSQIITFGTMAARGAIRDVGRALNVPYAEVDRLARLVPQEPGATLEKALNTVKDLKKTAADSRYRQLVNVAKSLEGLARHASTHAAGVVISPRPLLEMIPLYKSSKDEITTQYPMADLERLGLLKMDFLALATLTLLDQTVAQIHKQLGENLRLSDLDLTDLKVFELFCTGQTSGIFQFESAGMRDILRKLQPDRFEDLIALNALYRPGPLQGGMIDEFIARRHNQVQVDYLVPELEQILEETYGVIVYQEQVIQIASELGGFSLGEADLLRRAMGKKKKKVMQAQRKKFLSGCKRRGIDSAKARRIFALMEQFAGYGFNKSHSTAYALLAYQTAYLKTHYPVQFMASLLTNEKSNSNKIVKYFAECKDMGIPILPPDINASHFHFVADDANVKFGLAAIRNVGESAIHSILDCRRKVGQFSSFQQFCEKVDLRCVNKRVLEALIKSGCFDSLGYRRKSLAESLDDVLERAQRAQRDRMIGQRGLFGKEFADLDSKGQDVKNVGEWEERRKWSYEKEALGYYVTGHPLQDYAQELTRFAQQTASQIGDHSSGKEVAIGGIISSLRLLRTRKGDTMATFQLEDLTGKVEVLLWPRDYQRCQSLLTGETPVLVRGRCEVDGKGQFRLLCSEMTPFDRLWSDEVRRADLQVAVPATDSQQIRQLKNILRRFPGSCQLEFVLFDPQQYRVRLIPNQNVSVNPVPSFIQEVENLFGENSLTLYT